MAAFAAVKAPELAPIPVLIPAAQPVAQSAAAEIEPPDRSSVAQDPASSPDVVMGAAVESTCNVNIVCDFIRRVGLQDAKTNGSLTEMM